MKNQVSNWSICDGEILESKVPLTFIEAPVYEVIRLIEGLPLFMTEHMSRLSHSIKLAEFQWKLSAKDVLEAINKLVSLTGLINHNVRLEIGKTNHGVSWILFMVETHYPNEQMVIEGVEAVTANIIRHNPHAKIFREDYAQKINSIRQDTGAFEVILLDDDEHITEGSRSNLFFVKDNMLITAPESEVLLGISRLELFKLLKRLDIPVQMRHIRKSELGTFDACFLTGTSIKVLPIARIDLMQYDSASHPLIRTLIEAFDEAIYNDINNLKILEVAND